MNEKSEKWLTIILPMPADEFDAFLKHWRDENMATLEDVDPNRFAVDVILTKEGQTPKVAYGGGLRWKDYDEVST